MTPLALRIANHWLRTSGLGGTPGTPRCTYCGDDANSSGMCDACDKRMNGKITGKPLMAGKKDDVVSQVGDILHGRGTTDEAYDKEIVDYCDETRKTLKKLEAIFDKTFHDVVDFKENIPAADNPKVRQLAQEQLSEMINQAATRVELLSYTLRNEIESLLSNLEAGAKTDE